MDKITVPFITGDGVGVEITPSMQAIVNAAVQKAYSGQRQIEWMENVACGYLMKRWKLSVITKWVSKVR